VEHFKYLGTTLTNQNSIRVKIKSRQSDSTFYHPVQDQGLPTSYRYIQRLNTKNYNFACCFLWVWNLVSHTEGGI